MGTLSSQCNINGGFGMGRKSTRLERWTWFFFSSNNERDDFVQILRLKVAANGHHTSLSHTRSK